MLRKAAVSSVAALTFQLAAFPAVGFDTRQGGSLALDEIMPLIGSSKELRAQVNQALVERKKKPAEIFCDGMRFPGQWTQLGSARVSPYSCDFGDKWLQIAATVRLTDRRGRAFEGDNTRSDEECRNDARDESEVDVDDRRPVQGAVIGAFRN
jgi:hypothetical protein